MNKFLILLIALSFFGCEQNPYPDVEGGNSGDYRKPDGRDQQRKVPPNMSADFPKRVIYKEGIEEITKLKFYVKAPAKPIFEVKNLPAGAAFDEETATITWRPSFFDGNDPKDPSIKTRIYPITVMLRSTSSREEGINENIDLIVYDVPQNLDVVGSDTASVKEGEKLTYEFTVENPDYPAGPFKVVTSDMPSNTSVKQINAKTFKLEFEPDYYHVSTNDKCGWKKGCKEYLGKLHVSNPAGHQSEKELEIKAYDHRLKSKIVTPEFLTQGLDVSFQVAAYDLNKEVVPRIQMTSSRPGYGDFKFTQKDSPENNSSVLNIEWNDIPPSHNGETITLAFNACVYDSERRFNNCQRGSTNINIKVRERKPPVIDRSSWPPGQVRYLGFNASQTHYISIKDGEDPNISPKVEIFPEEMREHVQWSKGRLGLRFDQKGIFQFNLVATSDYNVQSAESFLVEVFNENRAKVLFFADSTKDEEVKFYKDAFSKMDIMNPVIQDINTRNISERETLIIGTSILKDNEIQDKVFQAMDKIDNVVIATPLIERMPEKFLDKFRNRYKVSIIGRYSDLPNVPELKTMEFVNRVDFQDPSAPLKLKLKASDQSYDPVVFSTGVDTNNCEDVLEIADQRRLSRFKVGVICDRIGRRGRLAVLGTEWADLKPEEPDAYLPVKWLKTMLSTRLNQERSK